MLSSGLLVHPYCYFTVLLYCMVGANVNIDLKVYCFVVSSELKRATIGTSLLGTHSDIISHPT